MFPVNQTKSQRFLISVSPKQTEPDRSWTNKNQSRPLTNQGKPIQSTQETNQNQSRPLMNQSEPIQTAHEPMTTNPDRSWTNENQSRLLTNQEKPIQSAQEPIRTNPDRS